VGLQPVLPAKLGDELLARYAGRGSKRAFAAIYERYHQRLYAYCRSILRNDEDARDALQATFAAALAALQRRQRSAPLRPWLFTIAHNEAISLTRRRKRDAADELDELHQPLGRSAEEEAAGRARWELLVDDLAQLPERLRSALLLRELSGLSHEEIALAIGTTVGGAKQAILEARRALVDLEEGRAMRCEDVHQRLSDGDRRVLRGRRVSAHLRECDACRAFAASIAARQNDLRALAPCLPAVASAAVFARAVGAGSGHAAAGTTSAAVSAVVGKAAGTTAAWKAVAGAIAVVATASAGVAGVRRVFVTGSASAPAAAHATPAHAGVHNRSQAGHEMRPSPRRAGTHAAGPAQAALGHRGAGATAAAHRHHSYSPAPRTAAAGSSSPPPGHTPAVHGRGLNARAGAHGNGRTMARGHGRTPTHADAKTPKPARVTNATKTHAPGPRPTAPAKHTTSAGPVSTTPATTTPATHVHGHSGASGMR
jgi:RNA polymerase sigma factor (sigma-70 family)